MEYLQRHTQESLPSGSTQPNASLHCRNYRNGRGSSRRTYTLTYHRRFVAESGE
jgi:hypothetical protein